MRRVCLVFLKKGKYLARATFSRTLIEKLHFSFTAFGKNVLKEMESLLNGFVQDYIFGQQKYSKNPKYVYLSTIDISCT